jgi:glyoxylase-like metal-dependent hydrolase (beta-lactamase superfamily II)
MPGTGSAPRAAPLPKHERAFDSPPGQLVELTPLVRRMVAGNGGPFTFTGTCSYVIGRGSVAILDPGPDDPAHVAALLHALRGESVSHVIVTHTHRDHSPAVPAIVAATGAKVMGCAPHHAARALALGETNRLDASADHDYAPDLQLHDGDVLEGRGWTLTALATPGHTANHLAFALKEEKALFSGDHVMAWSTSIVAPPDGSMADYMASLERLRGRRDAVFWPGHGGPVRDTERYVRALVHHRRQREHSILARVTAGDRGIPAITAAVYEGLDPRLMGAAALSVFAHLEDMVARGLVRSASEDVTLDADFVPA